MPDSDNRNEEFDAAFPGYQRMSRRYMEKAKATADNMRMRAFAPDTFEQLLALPLGSELALFKFIPEVYGIAGTVLPVNETFREETRKYVEEGHEFPFDFAVYLLPDDVVPDEVPNFHQSGDDQTGD